MTLSLQKRIAGLSLRGVLLGSALVFSLSSLSRADDVNWGSAGNALNANLIPGTGSVRYTNVNGQGFDIVVTTKNLAGEGMGNFGGLAPSLGSSFWFEGPYSSSSIPSSLVEFQFFKMGTSIPVAVTGVAFSLQDAEVNERFLNFGYYDQSNTLQLLPDTSAVFAGSQGGIDQTLGTYVIQNNAPYQGSTQMGKALNVDLSSTPITGFVLDPYRSGSSSSNSGSVEMTGLGDLQVVQSLQLQDSPVPEASSALYGLALAVALACSRWRQLPRLATPS
jgi:hypothetical protein